jgi:single-stranded-DNA-specific exonuclease
MQGLTRNWMSPPASDASKKLRDRILEARGFVTKEAQEDFLRAKWSTLEDPNALPGASVAGDLLCEAAKAEKKILIYGDYDADGVTASTVLHHIIATATGREGPQIYIPDRIEEGYGINVGAIEQFARDGVDLVVSVDCGITAIEAAAKAKELGIILIVTDHHKPLDDGTLPECAAIVHPSLNGDPSTYLAGVGVAFTVARVFARAWSGSQSITEQLSGCLKSMFPFVAIGTIADMVPLQNGNRVLVRKGLDYLPSTTNPGLRAIMRQLKTPLDNLNSSHISFGIAPLINAVGRLHHAAKAVDLFTHLDGDIAESTASELAKINRDRQKIQRDIIADALEQISQDKLQEKNIIVLQSDAWNRGVVGVAAGKCIETHYRPTILLSGDGDDLVGSARSISGFSIYDAISACKEHVITFGGHDMAAGLRVARGSFDDFVSAITAYANKHISPEQLIKKVKPDVVAFLEELDYKTACGLEEIGPFGIGNPTPTVQIMSARIDEVRVMGNEGAHLMMQLGESQNRTKCIWWNKGEMQSRLNRGDTIDLVANVKANDFRGHKSAELNIIDIKLPSG